MTVLSKVIHRFNTIPYPNLNNFFEEMKMVILQFMWNYQEPQISKTILKKKKIGGLIPPSFKMYYKCTMDYYSALKRNEILKRATITMKPEHII